MAKYIRNVVERRFTFRHILADGSPTDMTVTVYAEDEDAARLKLRNAETNQWKLEKTEDG